MASSLKLQPSLILALLLLANVAFGAFTLPVTSSGNDTVDQNSAGTWCYYPSSNRPSLDAGCTGTKGDFRAVMQTHLSQGMSISYYSASNERLGGAEFPVEAARGKVYLCLSGRSDGGFYKTSCELSTKDNQFGGNQTVCAIAVGQTNVTDGCYAPGAAGSGTHKRLGSYGTFFTALVSLSLSLMMAW